MQLITRIALVALAFGLLSAGAAWAEGEIELKTTAQQEIVEVDAAGKQVTRLVPAAKVIPGDVVLYTITARNLSGQPVERVVVQDPIPEHMTYVMGSATGEGSEIVFSVDGGKSYDGAGKLNVTDAEGTIRPAEAKDYTHIRWVLVAAIPPAETRAVSFRARLD